MVLMVLVMAAEPYAPLASRHCPAPHGVRRGAGGASDVVAGIDATANTCVVIVQGVPNVGLYPHHVIGRLTLVAAGR